MRCFSVRLDETTLQNPEAANTANVIYSIDSIDGDSSDLILNPYGMALLTNDIKNMIIIFPTTK
ncbi:MAG: hypothetical protein LBL07_15145 [Tannerella sp.]|nr:hypothetical protein [Tannerella sp.]